MFQWVPVAYLFIGYPFSCLRNGRQDGNLYQHMAVFLQTKMVLMPSVRCFKCPISYPSSWNESCRVHGLYFLTLFNSLRPRQDVRHFPNNIFKCIFWNENAWILIKISLKVVPWGPINNIPALFQIMAWCQPGDKPLSEPVMVRLLMHICFTRPQ